MAKKPAVKKATSARPKAITVGRRVYVMLGSTKREAKVIEDRGAIGIGGRKLLRVAYVHQGRPAEETFEIPADEVGPVKPAGKRRTTLRNKLAGKSK